MQVNGKHARARKRVAHSHLLRVDWGGNVKMTHAALLHRRRSAQSRKFAFPKEQAKGSQKIKLSLTRTRRALEVNESPIQTLHIMAIIHFYLFRVFITVTL
jgi:hypothetical protein